MIFFMWLELLDTKDKVRIYKKMCLVKSQELDKHARKKLQPHLSGRNVQLILRRININIIIKIVAIPQIKRKCLYSSIHSSLVGVTPVSN